MWIRLHFYNGGDEVVVQSQNICAVFPDQREYSDATCVKFAGTDENYIQVRETVDRIGELITE